MQNPVDARILRLIDILKSKEVIRFNTDFCRTIDLRKQNLTNIKNEINHFTPEHIRNIVIKYKVNANWIFGVSDQLFRTTETIHKPVHKR